MKLLGIAPRQIVIGLEFTVEDLSALKIALDNATFNLDLKNPMHQTADSFVMNDLYPTISSILKDIEGADAPSDFK